MYTIRVILLEIKVLTKVKTTIRFE